MLGKNFNRKQIMACICLLICFKPISWANDEDESLIIRDPPTTNHLPLLSERIKNAKTVAIVRITQAKEIQFNQEICGYEYIAKIVEAFKGEQVDSTINFMSFQPNFFNTGGYYLAILDNYSETNKFLSKSKGDVFIEEHGNRVNLSKCSSLFKENYGDSDSFFPINPSYSNSYSEKWIVLNPMSMKINDAINNDTKNLSPCEEENKTTEYCVRIEEARKFISSLTKEKN